MLKLSSGQWSIWAQKRQADFVERLKTHLREAWPEEWRAAGEQRMGDFVRCKVEAGVSLGLSAEVDVARFVTLAFVLRNGEYDLEDWAQQVLIEEDVPARIRMNNLWALTRERLSNGP